MKVFLLGATGNVGSRVLASLLVHGHTPILYLRSPEKLPPALVRQLPSDHIIIGSGTDSAKITKAILDNECDALITAAGVANMFSKTEAFPKIFKTVAEAAVAAGKAKGKPLRAWFMAGFAALDFPENITGKKGQMIMRYLPLYPDHVENFRLLQAIPSSELDWSTLCASQMGPAKPAGEVTSDGLTTARDAMAQSSKIIGSADVPPQWQNTLAWIPLIGTYLNAVINAGKYATTLEQTAEFIVRDLDTGMSSPYLRKRVGILAKA